MSKDNDILAQLLGGGKSPESQYADVINRRNGIDDMGDAFTDQSKYPAINAKQKMTNALMGGIGAGLKASQSSIRDRKLQELEEQQKEVIKYRMQLQQQYGQTKLREASIQGYALKRKTDFFRANDLYKDGKTAEFNELMGELYNDVRKEYPNLLPNMGKYLHSLNGVSVFEKPNGKKEVVDVKDAMQPFYDALPDEDKERMIDLVSLPIRRKIENKNLLEDLQIEKYQSDITTNYAGANKDNAHADYYRGETAKVQNQRLNPPKYDEKTAQHIAKSNIDWVNTMNTDVKKTERAAKSHEMYADILTNENKDPLGRGGNSLRAKIQRFVNFEGTESAKNQALLDLYQQPLLEEFKYYFGSKATDTDLNQFLGTLSSLNKDAGSSIKVARERAAAIRATNKEQQLRAKILETEFNYGEPYNSQAVTRRVDEEMKTQSFGDLQ